jgi:hypothetical protein
MMTSGFETADSLAATGVHQHLEVEYSSSDASLGVNVTNGFPALKSPANAVMGADDFLIDASCRLPTECTQTVSENVVEF